MKQFQIILLSLLLLIFGALFGILVSLQGLSNNNDILLGKNELENAGFFIFEEDTSIIANEFRVYSYSEFSKVNNIKTTNLKSILEYLVKQNFKSTSVEEEIISLELEKCSFNQIYVENLCEKTFLQIDTDKQSISEEKIIYKGENKNE